MGMLTQSTIAVIAGFGVLSACQPSSPPPPPVSGESEIAIGASLPFHSEVLDDDRRINVYLPWGYDQRRDRFPVLYLIDGGVEQDFVPVAGFSALASLSGQYGEFILVGIETENRRYELTTPSDLSSDTRYIPDNGGAEDFRRYIVEEVQPFIERRYHTSGETAVLGESLAGLFIMDTFLKAPESFDTYIAVSPSLWWRERELALDAGEYLEAHTDGRERRLFLTHADETDIIQGVESVVAALETHTPDGLTWWYLPFPDEQHHTIYHPATLEALRLIWGETRE